MGESLDLRLPEPLNPPEGGVEVDMPGLKPSSATCLLCDLG